MSVRDEIGPAKTAFVFAGGGSFGAIQVGMLHSLAAHGIAADMVVGSSVGALNGAFYAGDPTLDGVQRLADDLARLARGRMSCRVSARTLLSFLWRRDFLIPHDGIRKLADDNIPFRRLEDAPMPVHIVTTDISRRQRGVVRGPDGGSDRGFDRDPRCVLADPTKIVTLPMAPSPATRRYSVAVNKGAGG